MYLALLLLNLGLLRGYLFIVRTPNALWLKREVPVAMPLATIGLNFANTAFASSLKSPMEIPMDLNITNFCWLDRIQDPVRVQHMGGARAMEKEANLGWLSIPNRTIAPHGEKILKTANLTNSENPFWGIWKSYYGAKVLGTLYWDPHQLKPLDLVMPLSGQDFLTGGRMGGALLEPLQLQGQAVLQLSKVGKILQTNRIHLVYQVWWGPRIPWTLPVSLVQIPAKRTSGLAPLPRLSPLIS